jgi:hypothetical protein
MAAATPLSVKAQEGQTQAVQAATEMVVVAAAVVSAQVAAKAPGAED